jgi:CDP-glucose 4,6-dehydratase
MFKKIYKGKKILITGNTGFKGAWLSQWLVQMEADVYGVSNIIPTNPSLFEVLDISSNTKHVFQDIRDADKIYHLVDQIKPDFVFHLAAQSIVSVSYNNPIETISTNVIGTTSILDALKRTNHPCIAVIITSDKCYENVEWLWGYRENDRLGGKDIYSASKGAAELIIHAYHQSFFQKTESNVRIVSARAGNVIGGGDWAANRIVPDCFRAWSQKLPVEIRNPQSTRPWQHVLEPLSGYLSLGQLLYENPNLNGESFNFGPNAGQNQTVLKVLKELGDFWEFEKNKENFIYNKQQPVFHEAGLLKLNCDKALHDLHWLPTLNFQETIRFTGEWYNAFYKQKTTMSDFTNEQISSYISIAKSKNLEWTQ